MTPHTTARLLAFVAFLCLGCAWLLAGSGGGGLATASAQAGACAPLPLPSAVGVVEYERRLIPFLQSRCYQKWTADRQVRDTGPFVGGVYYGTHPAVKVFYSPEAWEWIKRREQKGFKGDPADGAMIVKEQFAPPAAAGSPLNGWSIMVRDKRGAWDGWYWSGHGVGDTFD